MPPTIFKRLSFTAALSSGVADRSVSTVRRTFSLVAFSSWSPGWPAAALSQTTFLTLGAAPQREIFASVAEATN